MTFDDLDTGLYEQADRLTSKIKRVVKIDDSNVVEAAQLWREAQLTLEAAVLSGDAKAFTNLSSAVIDLQDLLASEVPALVQTAYSEAQKQETLRDGLAKWAVAGAYLSLYPNDGTPDSVEISQRMGYDHENIRQVILQTAQTHYNLWACERIKKAWVDIKDAHSPISSSDRLKFYHTCVHFLAPIDTTLLGMSTGELYREVLHFVRERMPLDLFQDLVSAVESGEKRTIDDVLF